MYPIGAILNEQNAGRFGLSFLFEKYYTAEQKIDRLILNEMIDLQNRAEAEGIPVAFFKGMIEKTDTYEDYAVKRTQKDIDLLVSLGNIYAFCGVCEQAGYTVRDDGRDPADMDIRSFGSTVLSSSAATLKKDPKRNAHGCVGGSCCDRRRLEN